MAFADGIAAAIRVAGLDAGEELLSRGITVRVSSQVGSDLTIRLNDPPDELRLHNFLLQFSGRAGRGGDETFQLELVGVEHQPDH